MPQKSRGWRNTPQIAVQPHDHALRPANSRGNARASWDRSRPLSRSQKALRVDIDFELDVALVLGRGGEPRAQIGGKIKAARRFDQQAEAMAPAHDCKRRFGRPENAQGAGNDAAKAKQALAKARSLLGIAV